MSSGYPTHHLQIAWQYRTVIYLVLAVPVPRYWPHASTPRAKRQEDGHDETR
jgi:hypothetical protein